MKNSTIYNVTGYHRDNSYIAKFFNKKSLLTSKICYTTQKINVSFFLKFFLFTILIWILDFSTNGTCKFFNNKHNLGTSVNLRVKRILSDCTHLPKLNKSELKVNLLDTMEKEDIPEHEKVQQQITSNLLLTKTKPKNEENIIDIFDQSKNENTNNKNEKKKDSLVNKCSIISFCCFTTILVTSLYFLKKIKLLPLSNDDLTQYFLLCIYIGLIYIILILYSLIYRKV
ncbi:fam-h protein [Plasmodium relictum]|uniref:Fam-h protein n=1 Tax=Plasmodium relictum TaxID=85471 RepID=A0A1J1GJX9_PLARL|nr:fam-h protein [Plasmodium relictum]CRG84222.1 fam-h protein [Plasmodium relictum]